MHKFSLLQTVFMLSHRMDAWDARMRCVMHGFSWCVGAALFVSLAGCATPRFVYSPATPANGAAQLQMKVAVLPFTDGTENFTTRGNAFGTAGMTINLVKAGFPGTTSALTAELWGKYCADDLRASGTFRQTRFIFTRSELLDEELIIDGTVEKAYAIGSWDRPIEIAISFRALRRADNRLVWEKRVTKVWTPVIQQGCGLGTECIMEQRFADMNRAMRDIFSEARESLVGTLTHAAPPGAGESLPAAGDGAVPPLPQESVEQTIQQILRQK